MDIMFFFLPKVAHLGIYHHVPGRFQGSWKLEPPQLRHAARDFCWTLFSLPDAQIRRGQFWCCGASSLCRSPPQAHRAGSDESRLQSESA